MGKGEKKKEKQKKRKKKDRKRENLLWQTCAEEGNHAKCLILKNICVGGLYCCTKPKRVVRTGNKRKKQGKTL